MLNSSTTDSRSLIRAHAKTLRILWIQKTPPSHWQGFENDLGPVETDDTFDRPAFMDALGRFLTEEGLSTDWESLGEAEDELLINSLSMLCPFAPEDKQALLEAPSLTTRRETLMTLIEYALRGGSSDEVMQ